MRSNQLPNLRGLVVNAASLKIAVIRAINGVITVAKRHADGYSANGAAEALSELLVEANDIIREYTRAASISVTPATDTLDASNVETQQLTTVATYEDGETTDVSADTRVTYVSSDPTKATVSSTGLITAVLAGSTTITTSYHGRTDTTVVTVVA